MFYCKYCSDTLEIIKNTNLSNEENMKQIESPDELVEIYFNDLESKKPGNKGISAKDYSMVIGKKLNKDLAQWSFINVEDID